MGGGVGGLFHGDNDDNGDDDDDNADDDKDDDNADDDKDDDDDDVDNCGREEGGASQSNTCVICAFLCHFHT